MKNKLFFVLSLSIVSILGVCASVFSSRPNAPAKAEAAISGATSDAEERIIKPETELILDDDPLSVELTNLTRTEYGSSFDLKFATGEKVIYDTENIVNIADDTGALLEVDDKISAMDLDFERTEYYKQLQDGTIKPIEVPDCFIYSFRKTTKISLVVPRTLYRGEGVVGEKPYYIANINAIGSKALNADQKYVEKLYIPNTIDKISSDAFIENTSLTRIYVECPEDEVPAGWEEGWNNHLPVTYGYDIYDDTRSEFENISYQDIDDEVGDKKNNYIIGNYPTPEMIESEKDVPVEDKKYLDAPLIVEYKLVGDNALYYHEMNKTANSTIYDGIGYEITGFVNKINVVLDLKKGQNVDFNSIKVHNVFKAVRNPDKTDDVKFLIDKSHSYYLTPEVTSSTVYNLSDFLNIKFNKVYLFNGFICINTTIDLVNSGLIYKQLKPSMYNTYEQKINSGSAYIRAGLTQLPIARYRIIVDGKEMVAKVKSPISQISMDKTTGNRVNFMIEQDMFGEKIDLEKFEAFALENITITLDVVDNGAINKRTAVGVKFGCIYFYTPDEKISTFNVNLLLVLIAVGYSVLAVAVAIFLFFLYKKIYRNDEFRRLKPKQFIRKAIIYWLTSLAVVLFVTFVILRVTILSSSIVVYNPADVFITFLGIATIIIIGYYVKELVAFAKANKQRKKALKLGLGNDVADDGTK